jgi:hypothetical protein
MHKRVAFLGALFSVATMAGCAVGGEDDGSFGTFSGGSFGDDSNLDMDAGTGTDDEAGTQDGTGDGDTTTTGDGDTTTTTGDGDTTTTTTGDGDTTTTTGDGDTTTTTGDGDTTGGAMCGNGVIDPGETCDGNDFGGVSCTDLGFDGGTLTCNSCAVSTSTCTNAAQPGLGQLYSHCLDSDGCPGLDGCVTVSMMEGDPPYDGFCTNLCSTDAECSANVGGTAVPQCNDLMQSYCELDCSGGKTCPGGMECIPLTGGSELCF